MATDVGEVGGWGGQAGTKEKPGQSNAPGPPVIRSMWTMITRSHAGTPRAPPYPRARLGPYSAPHLLTICIFVR